MQLIVPLTLFIAVGCILAAGCITSPDIPAVNVSPTFTVNTTIPAETHAPAKSSPQLDSSLKVSVSGLSYPANLSVVLDNETVGVVTPTTPLYLMVSEGNHTVMVCESSVCEQENVTTRFGMYAVVDFSEKIQRNLKFPNPMEPPSAQILEYYRNGDVISVKVEFFNPSTKDIVMSAEVNCLYSYLDSRTNIKREDSAKGIVEQNVSAGQSVTTWLDLRLAKGYSYNYRSPIIEELKVK